MERLSRVLGAGIGRRCRQTRPVGEEVATLDRAVEVPLRWKWQSLPASVSYPPPTHNRERERPYDALLSDTMAL